MEIKPLIKSKSKLEIWKELALMLTSLFSWQVTSRCQKPCLWNSRWPTPTRQDFQVESWSLTWKVWERMLGRVYVWCAWRWQDFQVEDLARQCRTWCFLVPRFRRRYSWNFQLELKLKSSTMATWTMSSSCVRSGSTRRWMMARLRENSLLLPRSENCGKVFCGNFREFYLVQEPSVSESLAIVSNGQFLQVSKIQSLQLEFKLKNNLTRNPKESNLPRSKLDLDPSNLYLSTLPKLPEMEIKTFASVPAPVELNFQVESWNDHLWLNQ